MHPDPVTSLEGVVRLVLRTPNSLFANERNIFPISPEYAEGRAQVAPASDTCMTYGHAPAAAHRRDREPNSAGKGRTPPVSDVPTTKQERDELTSLVRRRAKLAKREAERLAAQRLTEFENALATEYTS